MIKKAPEQMNGFLDRGVTVKGEIHFTDMLRVDGRVEGKVVSDWHLVVGGGGEIEGEIEVGHATLGGAVRGVVRGKERIEILQGAKIFAELHTPVLVIEEGAFFEGKCNMTQAASAAKPAPLAAVKG